MSAATAAAGVKLRPATRADVPGLLEVERRSFVGVYAEQRLVARQFRYYLDHPNARVTVAVQAGEVVGYSIVTLPADHRRDQVYLQSVAVLPRLRGQRVGVLLMERYLAEGRRHRRRRAVLEVTIKRPGTRRYYEHLGFKVTRLLPHFYGRGHTGVEMERAL